MSTITTLLLAALICVPALGQKLLPTGKPDLSGRWQLQTKNGQATTGTARVIEQDDSKIRITSAESDKTETVELDCGTRGKECDATIRGAEAKVTLWYNGPTLVEMARLGKEEVVETRRAVSEDGNKLTVTVTTLAPAPKEPEVYVFTRAATDTRAAVETPATK